MLQQAEDKDKNLVLKFTYFRNFQEYHIYVNEKEELSTTDQELAINTWNSLLEKHNLLGRNATI